MKSVFDNIRHFVEVVTSKIATLNLPIQYFQNNLWKDTKIGKIRPIYVGYDTTK